MSEAASRRWLALLVAVFVVLGVTYSLATPLFESPDESSHLALVRYFATHRTLPPLLIPAHRPVSGADVAQSLAYHDPPLYYAPPLYHALGALLTAWADTSDLPSLVIPSPSWEAGYAPQPGSDPANKNVYVHLPQATLAASGTAQAAAFLRGLSLALGAATVVSAYAIARTLWPERRVLALGAAAFVALNPQFIAVSAGVTNDALLNALFSLCLLLMLRGGASWRRWAALGGLAGLGLLTKQSALLLLPLGLLAVWQQYSRAARRWNLFIVHCSLFLVSALAVGGWWYVRNAILYGDLLGLTPHLAGQTPLARFGLGEALMAARSYWAAFGWTLILVEPPVYVAIGLVMLAALIGIVMAVRPAGCLWREPVTTQHGLTLLGLAVILNVASFVRWAVATGAPYGRLLFPTAAAAGVLSAWGLAQWTRWKAARWVLGIVAALALVFAALVPWHTLRPAFASPRLPDGVPEAAQSLDAAFEGGVQLAGYEVSWDDLRPAEPVRLTLYWRAPSAPNQRYRAWAQLGPQDATRYVANSDVWLGGTLYPSDLWQPGDTVRQVYRLAIPAWASAPGLYWVRAGLVDETGARVALADGGDTVTLGPWRMGARLSPAPPACAADYRLGDTIHLLGYNLEQQDGSLQLALYWLAVQTPGADYTVFAHLVDGEGSLVGQHDGPPREGNYPTSWWLPGEIVVDPHSIRLDTTSAGELRVGMYDPATGTRLPAYNGMGQRLPDDAIPLAKWPSGGSDSCASD